MSWDRLGGVLRVTQLGGVCSSWVVISTHSKICKEAEMGGWESLPYPSQRWMGGFPVDSAGWSFPGGVLQMCMGI